MGTKLIKHFQNIIFLSLFCFWKDRLKRWRWIVSTGFGRLFWASLSVQWSHEMTLSGEEPHTSACSHHLRGVDIRGSGLLSLCLLNLPGLNQNHLAASFTLWGVTASRASEDGGGEEEKEETKTNPHSDLCQTFSSARAMQMCIYHQILQTSGRVARRQEDLWPNRWQHTTASLWTCRSWEGWWQRAWGIVSWDKSQWSDLFADSYGKQLKQRCTVCYMPHISAFWYILSARSVFYRSVHHIDFRSEACISDVTAVVS